MRVAFRSCIANRTQLKKVAEKIFSELGLVARVVEEKGSRLLLLADSFDGLTEAEPVLEKVKSVVLGYLSFTPALVLQPEDDGPFMGLQEAYIKLEEEVKALHDEADQDQTSFL